MSDNIDIAAAFIKTGNIVAFPTETVFGLGCDATNSVACQKIYELKNRPIHNPLIIHVENTKQAQNIGKFNDDANKLANHFWPGPLTLVLNIADDCSITKTALAGLNTVAIRIPAHKTAIELIKKAECPVAAPSANPSGYISSTTSFHVAKHFSDKNVLILPSDNECYYGIESTILDLTSEVPTILRLGFITAEAISEILSKPVEMSGASVAIKAPGMLAKHYSPYAKVRLEAIVARETEIALNFKDSNLQSNFSLNLSVSGDLVEAANNLYKMLRILDDYALENSIPAIAIAKIPDVNIGIAINDRLKRAASDS